MYFHIGCFVGTLRGAWCSAICPIQIHNIVGFFPPNKLCAVGALQKREEQQKKRKRFRSFHHYYTPEWKDTITIWNHVWREFESFERVERICIFECELCIVSVTGCLIFKIYVYIFHHLDLFWPDLHEYYLSLHCMHYLKSFLNEPCCHVIIHQSAWSSSKCHESKRATTKVKK